MKRWRAWLLCGLLGAVVTAAPHRAWAAQDSVEQDEDSGPPEGCWKTWLCYMPPSTEAMHPDLQQNLLKVYLASMFLGFPYVQWMVPDAAKVAYTDEDLLDQLKAAWLPVLFFVPYFVICYVLMFTIILIPCAYVGLLVGGLAMSAWTLYFAPITRIHLVNRTLMRQGSSHKSKVKHAMPDDDDDTGLNTAPSDTTPPAAHSPIAK